MNDLVQINDQDIEEVIHGLDNNYFAKENPIFNDSVYYARITNSNYRTDLMGQRIHEVIFEVKAHDRKNWDTAGALAYLTRLIWIMKSLSTCSRLRVNYDTAHNSASLPHHATANITYVLSPGKIESGKKEILALKDHFLKDSKELEVYEAIEGELV